MPIAGRCAWEVRTGIIPGQVDAEHTRCWGLTNEEWEGPEGLQLLLEREAEAAAYARYLQLLSSQGRAVNWVETTFIRF